jgi:hypothetical protein
MMLECGIATLAGIAASHALAPVKRRHKRSAKIRLGRAFAMNVQE